MSLVASVNRKAVELGKLSVEMTTAAGSGHPSTALSLAHLVTVLMYHRMRWDPKNPWDPAADRLVLSEGHAVPIVYAALADLGAMIGKDQAHARPMTRDDALSLREIDSPIDGHPNPRLGVPFFDAATGSLGQGLSVAAGIAAAAQMDGLDRIAYCLIGDGESREGQIWEAMDFVVDHGLTNCVPIFNCNELAQSDWVSAQQSAEVVAKKAEAFGFVVRVIGRPAEGSCSLPGGVIIAPRSASAA
jgi:transketolase